MRRTWLPVLGTAIGCLLAAGTLPPAGVEIATISVPATAAGSHAPALTVPATAPGASEAAHSASTATIGNASTNLASRPTPSGVGQRISSGPLALPFDNAGVSDDGNPLAADLDGTGRSLSAQDLAAAGWTPGRRITLNRTRLTWPDGPPGSADNTVADGQRVRARGAAEALTFLAAATEGDASGTGEIVYSDGSRSPYTLSVPGWDSGPLSTKALALPHMNSPAGQADTPARLYAPTVPVDPGKSVEAVILPRATGGQLHLFAASLRRAEPDLTGSWAASTSGYTPVTGPVEAWQDQTLRLVVHSSAGGLLARIRLDNTFAARPVTIGRATIAVQGTDAVPGGAPVPLTFGGARSTRIPAGGQAFSDPASFRVPRDTNLLVSIYLPDPVTAAPTHTRAGQTSYLTEPGAGDHTGDTAATAFTGTLRSWPFLTGVDVTGGPGSVVTLGDSITDGTGSTHDANRRWPDYLARRLATQSQVPRYGVLNHGISANRVVTDRYQGDGVSTDAGGVSAQHRLDRDVLAQTGARTVIVFEGVNDVRTTHTSAADVIAGLRRIAMRAHAHGLRVLAATIAPCLGWSDCTEAVDARRQEVNTFLRGGGTEFDGVLDFDTVLRDPDEPRRLLPAYDSGDHLHPGDAGLEAVAASVDLTLLAGRPPGAG